MFPIIVLLHNPSVLELQVTNWWPDILLQDFLIEWRINGSSIIASRPGPEAGWGLTPGCVLFDQQWLLPWNSPMDAVFAHSLSYCWIMNTDLNWGTWGMQFFRCCSGFFYDLLDESSLRSRSNFGRLATPGKVHHCSKFSPFVDNGSDRGSLESQSLRNGFITLSRLIHFNYFVSHLFLNFFRSWHDVLLFKHASLCQTGFV